MPVIVRNGDVRICVVRERAGRHTLPHSHVFWDGGAARVCLITNDTLTGGGDPDPMPWDGAAFAQLRRVTVRDGRIVASFANGDVQTLPTPALAAWAGDGVEWPALILVEDMFVAAPAGDEMVEIPGEWLREAADPLYARYWAWLEADRLRQLGRKLGRFRRWRQFPMEGVAGALRIEPSSLDAIEAGDALPTIDILNQLITLLDIEQVTLQSTEEELAAFDQRRRAWLRDHGGGRAALLGL
jgi:hypothetical protein